MQDIRLINASKSYGEKTVFENLSLTVRAGDRICITGASGAGKTTIMRVLAGLEAPSAGKAEPPASCAIVFQEDRLIPHLSAVSNCHIVMPRRSDTARIKDTLAALGLYGKDIEKPVSELSGGMARRVCIARALLYDADVVFMDEPFKGLDGENRQRAVSTVNDMTRGKTLVIISHNTEDASALGANIYDINEMI